jgi:hypothetical protein
LIAFAARAQTAICRSLSVGFTVASMNSWSRFLLAMTLAGTVAAPALAQTTAPSGGTPASIPDFSGSWLHPGLGFGPPLADPGPVANCSQPDS